MMAIVDGRHTNHAAVAARIGAMAKGMAMVRRSAGKGLGRRNLTQTVSMTDHPTGTAALNITSCPTGSSPLTSAAIRGTADHCSPTMAITRAHGIGVKMSRRHRRRCCSMSQAYGALRSTRSFIGLSPCEFP